MTADELRKVAEYASKVGKILPTALPVLESALRAFMSEHGNDPSKAPSIRQQAAEIDREIDDLLSNS